MKLQVYFHPIYSSLLLAKSFPLFPYPSHFKLNPLPLPSLLLPVRFLFLLFLFLFFLFLLFLLLFLRVAVATEDGGRQAAQATPQHGQGPDENADGGGDGLPFEAAVADDGDGGRRGGGAVAGGDGGAVGKGVGRARDDVGGHWKEERERTIRHNKKSI